MFCVFCRAMTLDESEAELLMKEYTGPRYEIEGHLTVSSC